MTKEERSAYMVQWRSEHKGYGRKLRAWKRQEHAKIKAEFMAKTKTKAKPTTRTNRSEEAVWYPWMDQI